MKKIGHVAGHKQNTPYEFYFLVDRESLIQLDDIVIVKSPCSQGEIIHYGIVREIVKYTEASQYAIETELIIDKKIPYVNITVAKVFVTRIEPEIYIPPEPSAEVYLADKISSEIALYFDKMGNKIPIGFLRNGTNSFLNLDFIDGTSGAHINISGMSGVATKTSFATFLLFSLLQKSPNSSQYRAIIFNVKSFDLLYLNYKNNYKNLRHESWQELEEKYLKLGLDPKPFNNVRILVPPKKNKFPKEIDIPDSLVKANLYYFSLTEIFKKELFKFFFVDETKDFQSMERIISIVERHIQKLIEKTDQELEKQGIIETQKGYIENLDQLFEYIKDYLEQNASKHNESKTTINAFLRRFKKVKEDCNFLTGRIQENKTDIVGEIERNQLTVIDVHNLNEKAKLFVVSSILYLIYLKKEEENDRNIYFFVIDELNKYAPASSDTPIKEVIVDIAERGRSLGIILIGAQQTASQIDHRVTSNCAIRVIGRSDAFEISKSFYTFLSEDLKKRAIILKPGNMIISQPDCPIPFVISFPYPTWATRKDEVLNTTDIKKLII
ncbi:MAG: ATP-binding protein [Candidatus Calescibacterium sp.]|nr:ATP-binding protein [Candidatus Calescibacterium sp.]MDW8195537.1 ATP-binding protein [Candidatus Calescibacterium sp.]